MLPTQSLVSSHKNDGGQDNFLKLHNPTAASTSVAKLVNVSSHETRLTWNSILYIFIYLCKSYKVTGCISNVVTANNTGDPAVVNLIQLLQNVITSGFVTVTREQQLCSKATAAQPTSSKVS